MKKMFRVLMAMAVVGAMAVPARAADPKSADLQVSAFVEANCTIETEPLEFGSYDPIVEHKTEALTGTGSVKVTCTNGSPVTITLGEGANADAASTPAAPLRRLKNGEAYLTYKLFTPAANEWGGTEGTGFATTGTGTVETLTVSGEIAPDQNGAPTGSYTDTVVATVTF